MCKILGVSIVTVAVTCLVTLGMRIVSLEKEFVPSVAAQLAKGPADPPQDLKDLLQRTFDDDGFADQGSESGNRPFFDDFAWQSFIVLNWPAQAGLRGKADLTKKLGDSADQVVWETWKTGPEIVPPNGKAPDPWKSPRQPRKVLPKVSKFSAFREGGFEMLAAPLIDQRKKYVRYELAVNEIEFNKILTDQLYDKAKLNAKASASPGGKIEFPFGSIQVKAAWRELPDDPTVLERFYWRDADVVDWDDAGNEKLTPVKVGLVGFHIVTKTKQRPHWIWCTFEHEDNVVTSLGGLNPPSFNGNPKGTPWIDPGPLAPVGWEHIKPKKPLPDFDKVEVSRKLDLDKFPDTKNTNKRYRNHPQIKDTVWARYQLIRTQWPIKAPGTPLDSKPSPSTDVANTSMETYFQTVTCMQCHAFATKSQFVYFLELRVDPPGTVPELKKTFDTLKH